MNEKQNQSPEEKAAAVLKEVNQKIKDNPEIAIPEDDQPSAEEAAEQLKGSDADVDHSVGYDDQPETKETESQKKGSDADSN